MRIEKILTFIIIIFFFLVIGCSKNQYGIITAKDGLILRTEPTIKSDRLDIMLKGDRVIVLDTNGPQELLHKVNTNWYKVLYKNKEGWAFGGFVKLLKSDLLNAYMADSEAFIEFYEYKNNDFDMTVNLCQAIGTISGIYSINEKYINCEVQTIDFKGFLGDNISEFKFKIINKNEISYSGNGIGCGPYSNLKLFKFDK